jgi:hypothetical protein
VCGSTPGSTGSMAFAALSKRTGRTKYRVRGRNTIRKIKSLCPRDSEGKGGERLNRAAASLKYFWSCG